MPLEAMVNTHPAQSQHHAVKQSNNNNHDSQHF